MPSITSISQYTLTNLGPLTTTWTAPQSCATETGDVYLAPSSKSTVLWLQSTCGPQQAWYDCYPGGAGSVLKSMDLATPSPSLGVNEYYSPGLYCPDTWTTAGIAVKDGDGKLVSSSGLFFPTEYNGSPFGSVATGTDTATYVSYASSTTSYTTATETWLNRAIPTSNPGWNVLMEALGPSETAVVCCPSGYSAGFWGGCYSNLPASVYAPTTACQVWDSYDIIGGGDIYITSHATFTLNDIVIQGEEYSTNTSATVRHTRRTTIFTIPATQTPSLTGVVYAQMPTLIRKGEDSKSVSTNLAPGLGILAVIWSLAACLGAALVVSG